MSHELLYYIKPLIVKPKYKKHGEVTFYINKKLVDKNDEIALTLMYICDRKLFGMAYRILMSAYYEKMGKDSGVLICPFVNSNKIFPNLNFPGDVDLLIIPYESNKLIVSKSLAIEVKVIRAKFIKQQKSPNDFGFSQAQGLLDAGFPYVAVMHLIISDQSPEDKWKEVMMSRVINADTGEIELIGTVKQDLMPVDLMERAYGRLNTNCPNDNLGLLASYLELKETKGKWFPEGRSSNFNAKSSKDTLDKIADFYYRHFELFMDTSKW